MDRRANHTYCGSAPPATFDALPADARPARRAEAADPARILLVLTTNGSELRHAWPRADGSFVFRHVPAGAHLLDIVCPDLTYPQLRVDVSARLHGRAVASYADNPTRVRPAARLRGAAPQARTDAAATLSACSGGAEAVAAAAHPAAGAGRVL